MYANHANIDLKPIMENVMSKNMMINTNIGQRFYTLSNGTCIDLLMAKVISPLLFNDKGNYGVFVERYFMVDNIKVLLANNTLLEYDTSKLEAEVNKVIKKWQMIKHDL